MIKVISADDHPLVRAGLKHLLAESQDIVLAAEADDGHELLQKLQQETFDVALVDMIMPGRSGIDLIKQVKQQFPKLPIVVLSTHKEDIFALRTLKAGASGYLCKDYAAMDLLEAIRKVAKGGRYVSPAVAELMVNEMQSPSEEFTPHTLLSDREYQVFLMVASGYGTTQIADELSLSVKTVSTHKTRIKDKMKLANDSEFVRYALKYNLISDMGEQ